MGRADSELAGGGGGGGGGGGKAPKGGRSPLLRGARARAPPPPPPPPPPGPCPRPAGFDRPQPPGPPPARRTPTRRGGGPPGAPSRAWRHRAIVGGRPGRGSSGHVALKRGISWARRSPRNGRTCWPRGERVRACRSGRGNRAGDAEDQDLALHLADHVAEAGDVPGIAAIKHTERNVQLPLDVHRATAVEAEGVAEELDRVEGGLALLRDREHDLGPVERGLAPATEVQSP